MRGAAVMAAWLAVGVAGCLATEERPGFHGRSRVALGQSTGDSGACGSITYQGCCDGETLYYCKGGQVLSADCSQSPLCGWDSAASYYNCGTNGQDDPGGAYPKACVFGDAGPPNVIPCGSVTWHGCCHGETLYWCANGLQTFDCNKNPSCGWNSIGSFYDCWTSGQPDPSNTYPKACAFDAAVPDLGPPVPCGKVTWQGCCDGETLKHCRNGKLFVEDCAGNPSCGWSGGAYLCGMSGKPDPSGVHPKACAALLDAGTPDGPVPCGSVTEFGCCAGQTVYRCVGGALWSMACSPSPPWFCGWASVESYYTCTGKGQADPSGQVPKNCPFDAGVPDASLLDASPACGPVTHQGCCEGETLYWCAAGTLISMDCSKSPSCGWQPAAVYYDCNTDGAADPNGVFPMACGFDGGAPILDQGQRPDAAPPHDQSVVDVAGDAAPPTDSGCGCALVPRSPGGVTLLLLLALVVTLRRRPG